MPHFSVELDIGNQYSHVNKEGAKSGDEIYDALIAWLVMDVFVSTGVLLLSCLGMLHLEAP
jgi:hypothetical protein